MRIDTLQTYKQALEAGYTEEQALFEAETLSKAAEPELDLNLMFEKINGRFEMIAVEFKYLERIGVTIIGALVINMIFNWLK
jgi:hypothetical protein